MNAPEVAVLRPRRFNAELAWLLVRNGFSPVGVARAFWHGAIFAGSPAADENGNVELVVKVRDPDQPPRDKPCANCAAPWNHHLAKPPGVGYVPGETSVWLRCPNAKTTYRAPW